MIQEFDARRNAASVQAAEADLDRGDYPKSEQTLRAVLLRDAAHRDARLLLAEVLLLTERRPEAFTQLEHALRDHRDDARVHYAMAVLLDASGRPEEARAFYGQAAELNPDFRPYSTAHETAFSAEAAEFETADDPPGTRTVANMPGPLELLPVDDHVSAVDWDVAVPAAAIGKVKRNDETASNISNEIRQMLGEGREALAGGNRDAALARFEAAMAADPQNPQIPVHAAVAALEQNHPEAAVELLQPAARRFPTVAAVHRTLGAAYYRLGDYPSAQVALRRALSLDNSSGLSYLLMGCTLEKLGQPAAAAIHRERAAARDPRWRTLQR